MELSLPDRVGARIAVLGFVEGALQIVDLGPDVDASFHAAPSPYFQRSESWQGGESEIHFCDVPLRGNAAASARSRAKDEWDRELEQCALGVGVGDNGLGIDFFSGAE